VDLGDLTSGSLFIPSCPGLTGLTGACDRSDRWKVPMGFASGELSGLCGFGL
jgi:hypothetical protein